MKKDGTSSMEGADRPSTYSSTSAAAIGPHQLQLIGVAQRQRSYSQ